MADYGTIKGSDVRCRKSPNTSSDTWGYFQNGNRIPIWPVDYAPDWWETRWPLGGANRGYVSKSLVTADGSSGGGSTTLPGVSGTGPNSKVSAAMIRAGNGIWKQDSSTTHPQIMVLQGYLNQASAARGTGTPYTTPNGVYGSGTATHVNWYQAIAYPPLKADSIVGKDTLTHLEGIYGMIQ